MRILVIGLNYAPEPIGIGPYTAGLAAGLAERGHALTVIAGHPYYPQWHPYPGYSGGSATAQEAGVEVIRVPHYIPADPTGARRIVHHLTFAANALGPVLDRSDDDVDLVFVVAPSLLSVPIAAIAARRARAPLWLHVQDFEIEAALATGLLRGGGARLARAIEKRIMGSADAISTISPQMCARLAAKGIPGEQIHELRNWSTVAESPAADPDFYRRAWGLEGRKVVLYSGNIGNKQGLETVIEAARALVDRDDIAFVICGEGSNRARLEALPQGIATVRFHDLQPAERLADLLALADVHLLPQIAGAADLVLPSKLANMLASGRPVVATAEPGTGLAAEVEGCGIVTPPGDPAALGREVAALIDDPVRAAALGEAARARAAEHWSREGILDALESRMRELVAQARRA